MRLDFTPNQDAETPQMRGWGAVAIADACAKTLKDLIVLEAVAFRAIVLIQFVTKPLLKEDKTTYVYA